MSRTEPIRVLFDVTHPAHVHLFKHAIEALQAEGHETLVTSRDKEMTTALLDAYDIDHRQLSARSGSGAALAMEWSRRTVRLLRTARRFEPDVVVSHFNPAAVTAARAVGAESIVWNDDEANMHLLGRLIRPFMSLVCTPSGYTEDLGANHERYDGLHELAYLHPDRFEPDPGRLVEHGVDPDDQYFVLRFVSWGAHHDVGERGLSFAAKRELVDFLGERGTVYVSSEDPIPESLSAAEIPVPPEHVHHLLSYADLYAGDSQTMALEAGVLGTPSVRSNSFAAENRMGHFGELDAEYDLVISTGNETEAVDHVKALVDDPNAKDRWQQRRERFLADTVDVTGYMLDRIHALAAEDDRQPSSARHTGITS